MKYSIRKMFVLLAIVMSFVAVQNVCAAKNKFLTVTGDITFISDSHPNVVTIVYETEETEVYGVCIDYLCNQEDICLAVGDDVSFEYYEVECLDGTIKNKATSITAEDEYGTEVTVKLR